MAIAQNPLLAAVSELVDLYNLRVKFNPIQINVWTIFENNPNKMFMFTQSVSHFNSCNL